MGCGLSKRSEPSVFVLILLPGWNTLRQTLAFLAVAVGVAAEFGVSGVIGVVGMDAEPWYSAPLLSASPLWGLMCRDLEEIFPRSLPRPLSG